MNSGRLAAGSAAPRPEPRGQAKTLDALDMRLLTRRRLGIAARVSVLCVALLAGICVDFGIGAALDTTPLARAAAGTLGLLGVAAARDGATIFVGDFAGIVTPQCAAVGLTALYAAAVFASPAPLRARLWGAALGAAALAALNFVRIIAVLLVGARYPAHWGLAHDAMGQTIMLAAAFALWALWMSRAAPEQRVFAFPRRRVSH